MPNENTVFTPSSILFRPHQKPFWAYTRLAEWFLVEAPGTAPGSEWFISQAIYRHIWQASTFNISDLSINTKFNRKRLYVYVSNYVIF